MSDAGDPRQPKPGGCLVIAFLLAVGAGGFALLAFQTLMRAAYYQPYGAGTPFGWGLAGGIALLAVGTVAAVRSGARLAEALAIAAVLAFFLTLGICSAAPGPHA